MTEFVLRHHGVKGQKWGVRRKVQKAGLAANRVLNSNRQKSQQKAQALYDKNVRRSNLNPAKYVYASNYVKARNQGQTHDQAVRSTRTALNLSKVAAVALASPLVAEKGSQIVNKLSREITRPENIRKGKNIIQAIKRSPIRYVNGRAMQNVI